MSVPAPAGVGSLQWKYFLPRLSVDGCDLVTGPSSGSNKNDQVAQSDDQHKEPQTKISKELTKEPRRRSVSASYSQSLITNNNNNIHNCNLCQISVNSQSQLAQVNAIFKPQNIFSISSRTIFSTWVPTSTDGSVWHCSHIWVSTSTKQDINQTKHKLLEEVTLQFFPSLSIVFYRNFSFQAQDPAQALVAVSGGVREGWPRRA